MSEETQTKDRMDPWYAVRVRSNREWVVAVHLRERGYEQFVPSCKVERTWSDRKKLIEECLFSGYVFCRLDPFHRLPVLSIPGVVGIVGFGSTPAPIEEAEMQRVQAMVRSGLKVMPWPFLQEGDRVLIEKGPLAGLEGILQRSKGSYRIVVSLSLLQRSISAEIDRNWVRRISPGPPGSRTPRMTTRYEDRE